MDKDEAIEAARKIFIDIWCDSEMYESDFYYMAEAWLEKYDPEFRKKVEEAITEGSNG